nr:hypothetical protein [Lentzea terrae]
MAGHQGPDRLEVRGLRRGDAVEDLQVVAVGERGELVAAHGGTVTATSSAEGTAFTISVPW